jgi:hypothetical protein
MLAAPLINLVAFLSIELTLDPCGLGNSTQQYLTCLKSPQILRRE